MEKRKPTCDKENKPQSGFLSKLSSPARNALVHKGIDTLQELSNYQSQLRIQVRLRLMRL